MDSLQVVETTRSRFGTYIRGCRDLSPSQATALIENLEAFLGRDLSEDQAYEMLRQADFLAFKARLLRDAIAGKAVLIPRYAEPDYVVPIEPDITPLVGLGSNTLQHQRRAYELTEIVRGRLA